MKQINNALERVARRTTILAIPLLAVASGTAGAHGSGSYSGGMMGGGGWGLFGGTMGLWGFLWMGLLLAIPLYLVYALVTSESNGTDNRSLSVLRERYARGELSDEEFEQRRTQLERVWDEAGIRSSRLQRVESTGPLTPTKHSKREPHR